MGILSEGSIKWYSVLHVAMLTLVAACSSAPAETDPAVQKAIAILKAEPKIKDTMYQQNAAVRWTVGVIDDGTNRNGYAEYVCLTLKENGVDLKGAIVRVVDITKIAQGGVPGSSTSLGSMNCETWQPFD